MNCYETYCIVNFIICFNDFFSKFFVKHLCVNSLNQRHLCSILEVSLPFLLFHAAVLVEVDDAGGAFAYGNGHHFLHNFFDG